MNETKAFEVLKNAGYKIINCIIILHKAEKYETPEESEAIDYLCDYWDYSAIVKSEYEEELKCRGGCR